MKPNLSQILPYYLGTGLKVEYLITGAKVVHELTFRNIENAIFRGKPLMRSLSKLTEPITVEGYNDGKPFVPMMKLFEMVY